MTFVILCRFTGWVGAEERRREEREDRMLSGAKNKGAVRWSSSHQGVIIKAAGTTPFTRQSSREQRSPEAR